MSEQYHGRHEAGRANPLRELYAVAKDNTTPALRGAIATVGAGALVAAIAIPSLASSGGESTAMVAAPNAGLIVDDVTTFAAPALAHLPGRPEAADGPVDTAGAAFVKLNGTAAGAAAGLTVTDLAKARADAARAAAQREAARQAAARAAAARQAAARAAASRSTTRTTTPAPRRTTNPTPPKPVYKPPVPATGGIVSIAASLTGIPYVWGGTSLSGFDCSGYTQYVYARAGKRIPRTADGQQAAAMRVSNPSPGDLVFFGWPAYHVGIYVSPGWMYDAQRPGTVTGMHKIWTTPAGYGRF